MDSRTRLLSASLVLILGVELVGACTKPSPSSTATSGSGSPTSAAPAITPDAPVNDTAQNAVGRAKAFVSGARRRDTNAMAAAVSFPFAFHDPAGELCGTRERIFNAASELEELLTCVRKHEPTVQQLDSSDDLQTELLQPEAAPTVAPEMPAAAPGRTAVVTHLYGNGFTGHWTVQVDGAGVRELWVKDFYEAN